MQKLLRYIRTLKYLKSIQIYYRIYYTSRKILRIFTRYNYCFTQDVRPSLLNISSIFTLKNDWYTSPSSFCFINKSVSFNHHEINWEEQTHGLLWAYNLNYFDYLMQTNLDKEEGLRLILNFIDNYNDNKIGSQSYPISIRGINWIRFISKQKINDPRINSHLFGQYSQLADNLEYHILGNHLLENGFSLLFAGLFFKSKDFFDKAHSIIKKELNRQILDDGAHFELSPMYHKIIFQRIIESISLIKQNINYGDDLLKILIEYAEKMICWLQNITFTNGRTPLFADSAQGITQEAPVLLESASKIGLIINKKYSFNESGYRKFRCKHLEMIFKISNIRSDYQPGHIHNDIFSFELHDSISPIIVDTGVSTYEESERRKIERSTYSHNTIVIDNEEQNELWKSFRVGRRANVIIKNDEPHNVSAYHNGYRRKGILHRRSFALEPDRIIISDSLPGYKNEKMCFSFLHLYPGTEIEIQNNTVFLPNLKINFQNYLSLEKDNYSFSEGFNLIKDATLIKGLVNENSSIEIIPLTER